jgi:glycosidase
MHRFFLPLTVLFSFQLTAQEYRVEPPNWWTGMVNDTVQLLIRGADAGAMEVRVASPGVRIGETHPADSPNYLFVDLLILDDARPGYVDLQLTRDGQPTQTFAYELKQREREPTTFQGFDAHDVIYLITPDRFANGDPENDVVAGTRESRVDRSGRGTRHGGDLRGITDRVGYLDELGVTTVWPSPLLENDMDTFSYHGYAITDYYAVDPRFGTLADYRELADSLRGRGMKLVMDQVVNHCGSGHWWMEDLPFDDWLNHQQSPRTTNHLRTTHQDPYASPTDRELLTRGWFVSSMPDLNQRNPFMARYLIQNSIWWIETLGLGGVRQDTYPYPDPDFLTDWSCAIMSEYPDFRIVGEEWSYNPAIVAYWQEGKVNPNGYRSCLPSVMDFPLQRALIAALNEPESWGTGLIKLYEALANDFQYADPENLMVFGDNHDMDRLATQLHGDVDRIKMALTYLLTIRGIPQLYYGTEVLMNNDRSPHDHDIIRSDMPGGWAGDQTSAFTGAGLTKEQREVSSYLRTLLNWRKATPVIATGRTIHYGPRDGVYVYGRYEGDQRVIVVINKGSGAHTLDPADFPDLLNGLTTLVELESGDRVDPRDELTVGPMEAVVFYTP